MNNWKKPLLNFPRPSVITEKLPLRPLFRAYLFILLILPLAGHSQKQEVPLTRILFVFDGSQSMYGRWESGNKIDIAKELMIRMLDSLQSLQSEDFQLALRIYGHQKPVPPQDCNDTKLEVAFGFNNFVRIKRELRAIIPKGTTPIAHSLERAATDFPPCNNCRNIIILITDGVESCDGDPCAVSLALQKKGIVLKPFVIGIGLDENFRNTFECVGNYFDAADEKTFKNVLGIVISQALDNTTAQVNLLDINDRPTETDVPFTLYDHVSGKQKYNFVHTLNYRGLPDTLILDPLLTYDLVVHTIPPVKEDSIVVTAGKHTQIGASTPQGTLELKMSGRTSSQTRMQAIIRRHGKKNTLNVQDVESGQKYLVGKYDVEILTLPRMIVEGVWINQSKTTTLTIPIPGVASIQGTASGYGSIFKVMENGELEWVIDLSPTISRQSYTLQPGQYQVIFRPKNAQQTFYSTSQTFTIGSGSTTIVKLN